MKPILLPLLLPMLLPAVFAGAGSARGGLAGDALPVSQPLAFRPFGARAGRLPAGERTTVLRSEREYQALVGRPAPASIDFGREWVVFYGAGVQIAAFAHASISGVELTDGGHALRVHTALMLCSPGLDPAPGRGIPFALVRIERPSGEIDALRAEHTYLMAP
jgi:hypothetical protein